MTYTELRAGYRATIDRVTADIERLRRRIHIYGTLRFLLVVGIVAMWVVFDGESRWLPVMGSLLLAVPFVGLMVGHNRLSYKKEYAEALRRLCENEERGLDYDFAAFDGAADKVDAEHPFGLDLDIFGERSLFQSLNRTVVTAGREMLADWFRAPLRDKAEILRRQQAVEELATDTALRQHFYVVGSLSRRKATGALSPESLSAEPARFTKSAFWRAAIWIVPALWAVLAVLFAVGMVHVAMLSMFFIVCVVIANCKFRKITKIHDSTNRTSAVLESYSRLMRIVEGSALSSEMFVQIRESLSSAGVPASVAVGRLAGKLHALDQRANIFVMMLNIFVLWDIRSAIGVAKWQEKYSRDIGKWFDALTRFDALSSLAGFAFNHPDYTRPEIAESYFRMQGRGLGHPLMNRETCVCNDVGIDRHPYFMIVTGANMAGKSTYLRTVGVNFILACVGAPVCAERLTVFPCGLVTSLRTSDSLADNESYFFAELKRLKTIIDQLRSGERLFIILDEILKGTNSVDKQKGSLALVRQLVELRTCGIIATHDLLLGRLRDELPEFVENYRFEADITGDRLSFSYKLRDGIAENMNACFLMRKMGITVE